MPMLCNDRGARHAASRNRTTGTTIEIKEQGEACTLTCQEHGSSTTAPKWSVACEVARKPAAWCEACASAPPPEPKARPVPAKANGHKPPAQQTPEERGRLLAKARQAQATQREQAAREAAKAEAQQAREALRALPKQMREAERANRETMKAEARAFAKLDKARPGTDRYATLKDEWEAASRAASRANANLMGLCARERALQAKVKEGK